MANEHEIFESLFGDTEEDQAKEGEVMTNNTTNGSSAWKQKLGSRKLWAAVAAAVVAVVPVPPALFAICESDTPLPAAVCFLSWQMRLWHQSPSPHSTQKQE